MRLGSKIQNKFGWNRPNPLEEDTFDKQVFCAIGIDCITVSHCFLFNQDGGNEESTDMTNYLQNNMQESKVEESENISDLKAKQQAKIDKVIWLKVLIQSEKQTVLQFVQLRD